MEFKPLFRDHKEAFENALKSVFLRNDENSELYVGNWMYMHTEPNGFDAFKHIITREYIYVRNTVEGAK